MLQSLFDENVHAFELPDIILVADSCSTQWNNTQERREFRRKRWEI